MKLLCWQYCTVALAWAVRGLVTQVMFWQLWALGVALSCTKLGIPSVLPPARRVTMTVSKER